LNGNVSKAAVAATISAVRNGIVLITRNNQLQSGNWSRHYQFTGGRDSHQRLLTLQSHRTSTIIRKPQPH